jgi:predicted AAA+ superfamily ATPase
LLRQSSESLAGRIEVIHTVGFSADEVGHDRLPRLWLRGGYPRSFLAASEANSFNWRTTFIITVNSGMRQSQQVHLACRNQRCVAISI